MEKISEVTAELLSFRIQKSVIVYQKSCILWLPCRIHPVEDGSWGPWVFWNLFKRHTSPLRWPIWGWSVPKLSLPLHQSHLVLSSWISSLVRALQEGLPAKLRPSDLDEAVSVSKKHVFPRGNLKQRPLVTGLAERWGSARLGPRRAPPAAAPVRAPDRPSSSRARTSPGAAQPAQHTRVITARRFHSAGSSAAQLSSCLNGLLKWQTDNLVNYANLYADVFTCVLGGISSALETNGGIEEVVILGTSV